MSNATARRATSRPGARQEAARRGITAIGLLQVVIIALTLATAFIHLDKAITLSMFAAHRGGPPMPPPGAHPAGPPRGGGFPLPLPLGDLFYLNFAGYLVLLALLYLPLPRLADVQRRYHRLIRWLLIAFAALTILGYYAVVGTNPNALGELDKALEIGLIVFLLLEDYSAQVAGNPQVATT